MINWMYSGVNSHLWDITGHEFSTINDGLYEEPYDDIKKDEDDDRGNTQSVK